MVVIQPKSPPKDLSLRDIPRQSSGYFHYEISRQIRGPCLAQTEHCRRQVDTRISGDEEDAVRERKQW